MRLQTLSFSVAAGWSSPIDSALDSTQTLVLAFAAPGFAADPRPLRELRAALPTAHFLGCSTAGEIHGTRICDDSVSVAILRFESTVLRSASAGVATPASSAAAGIELGRGLDAPDLRGIFLLSCGDTVNGSELVRGINEVIHGRAIVTGGLAGDGDRFHRTWVVENGSPASGLVTAVGLYGDRVQLAHGSRGGWDIFGPERMITRSRGNVLFELDGRPALELYKEYLGERASGLPATGLLFPLSVCDRQVPERRVVRTILGIDEATQSLTFAGDVPEGTFAQLMRANFDRLVQGASDAAGMMADHPANGPLLSIAISCVGRRLVLGERAEEETEAVLDALPAATAQVGFYSYGEISPYTDGTCDLHNQTMTLTTVAER